MERFLAIFHRPDKISSVAQILLLEPFFFFFFFNRTFLGTGVPQSAL